MKQNLWLQKLGLSALAVLFALFILECVARVYASVALQERSITYDRVLGWRLIPNADKMYSLEEEPYRIVINSKGLRDKEYSYVKPASVFRVVVLGDSFVFGSGGVAQQEVFTELIEGEAENLEVINMGVPAYGPDQEYLWLQSEGLKYQPDLVVLGLFINDFEEPFVSFNRSIGRPKGFVSWDDDGLRFHLPDISMLYALSHHSYLMGGLDHRLRILPRSASKAEPLVRLDAEEKKRLLGQLLLKARALCQNQGVEFIVVYFPYRQQKTKISLQEVLDELAATRSFLVLDFMGIFQEAESEGPFHFQKDIHLNRRGHQLVAQHLYEFILRNTALGRHVQIVPEEVSAATAPPLLGGGS